MLQFSDIFAFIEVDGEELPQYGIDIIPEKNTVTCWVASHRQGLFHPTMYIQFHILTMTHLSTHSISR